MASAWVEDILNSLLSEILNWGTTAVICLIQINISRLIWFGNGWAYLAALKRLQNTRVTLCFDRNLTSFSKTWTVLFYYTPNRRCRRNRDTGYRIQRLLLFGWGLIPRCVLLKGPLGGKDIRDVGWACHQCHRLRSRERNVKIIANI